MFQWRAAFRVTMRGTMIMKTTTTMRDDVIEAVNDKI